MNAAHPTPTEATADALIIGGGPAGGLTAALLAGAGFRTLLVEAHAHLPARVCGAYLCPAGVALLDELQLVNRLTPRTRQIEGMILVAPDSRRLVTRFPSDGNIPPRGLALRRPEFDEALLQVAAERGALIKRGHRATDFQHGPDGWQVQLDDGSRLRSPLLIGADGRKSRVARILGLDQSPPQSRVAIHVDVVSLAPNPPYGEMHVFPDGTYIGLNPIGTALLNVSAVCDPESLRDTTPARFLEDHIQQSEHLRHRIARFAPDVRIGCTFPAAHAVRDVATGQGALVGDASGFIDPLTGEGIYQALWTAHALSRELIAARQAGKSTATALRQYAGFRRRRHRGKRVACRLFQSIIRRPDWSNKVLNLLALRPRVGDAFIGMIGNIYSPIQAFWRMVRPV